MQSSSVAALDRTHHLPGPSLFNQASDRICKQIEPFTETKTGTLKKADGKSLVIPGERDCGTKTEQGWTICGS